MQHEFDNTFESLLRRAAKRETSGVLPESNVHLDADSISAFAENALPDTTRALFAAHLADCSDCRQILINFATIQEAEESDIIETKTAVPAQPTWSERFARWFALPNLGYAAAVLTVLFVGVFAFVALQSRQQKPVEIAEQIDTDTDEAKAEKKRRAERTQPAQPEPTAESTPEVLTDAASNADASNANLAENTNLNADQSPNNGLPPSYRATQAQTNGGEPNPNPRQREPQPLRDSNRAANTSNGAPAANANTIAATPAATASPGSPKPGTLAQAAPNPTNKTEAKERARDEESSQIAGTKPLETQNKTASPAATLVNPVSERTIGSKGFQNLGGVWRDKSYNGQTTVNVSRGSDEYKKLDGGLRSIADNFKGTTVIVVWQGKAYRIS